MRCEIVERKALKKVLLVLLKNDNGVVVYPTRLQDQRGHKFRVTRKPEYGEFVRVVAENGKAGYPVQDFVEIID